MTEPAGADLEQLYTEHYRAILRYVVRRIGDADEAPDVTADVFLTALRRRTDVPRDRALPWLYRVAANVLADRRRSRQRSTAAYQRAGNDLVTRAGPAAEERLEWSDQLAGTLTALRTLSAADQEVLMLAGWEELRGADLATALGCSRAAAAVRLHRARARLKTAQAQYDDPARSTQGRSAGSTVVRTAESKTQGERS
ncbi:sigma-70 family RNA polymerase sigma factor [Kribbella sp. NPDC050281]|uniref:RNA polymerase sigma factor n=1 Tax=Kribbella sp. NPDC050281 TaxID=3155515 RepID=UPI0033CFB3BF